MAFLGVEQRGEEGQGRWNRWMGRRQGRKPEGQTPLGREAGKKPRPGGENEVRKAGGRGPQGPPAATVWPLQLPESCLLLFPPQTLRPRLVALSPDCPLCPPREPRSTGAHTPEMGDVGLGLGAGFRAGPAPGRQCALRG